MNGNSMAWACPPLRGRRAGGGLLCALALVLVAGPAAGQALEARVAAVGDGTAHLTLSPGPGVCGDGGELLGRRDRSGRLATLWTDLSRMPERVEGACVPGPLRVALAVRGGRVVGVDTRVGGPTPRGGTDLGRAAPAEAADYFLRLAERSDAELGHAALVAAILGDVDTLWRGLVRVARGARAPEVRARAAHELGWWAAQTVPGRPTGTLAGLKKRTPEPRVDHWIRIARADPDPDRRREALRLLGKSAAPRAVDFLAEYLERATTP